MTGGRPRSVSQVKTLAAIRGSGTHSNERHVHQFQIATLELEKARRGRERMAAMKRIGSLDERIREIDEIIRKRQEALGVAPGPAGADAAVSAAADAGEKRKKLRY